MHKGSGLGGSCKRMWYLVLGVLLFMGVWEGVVPKNASAQADEENCLMCHRHRGIARIDLKGNLRLFFVDEELQAKSVHGRVACRNCHVGITEIPHPVMVKKVNCGTQCHKAEPSTGTDFSHRPVYNNYMKSVHATDLTNPEPDKPVCKYCHVNPVYTTHVEGREKPRERVVARCKGCHTEAEWANVFYLHVEHRLMRRTNRSKLEIANLCATCHDNREMTERRGFSKKGQKAVYTYRLSYHYRALALGRTETATCTDCHAYYEPYSVHSVHLILKTSHPESSVHVDNRGKVCGQEFCHDGELAAGPKAKPGGLDDMDLHTDFEDPDFPVSFWVSQVFFILDFGFPLILSIWMFLELFRRLF